MADAKAAERACRDPNPIIDGRKANVNLAYLGAKPRGKPLNLSVEPCACVKKNVARCENAVSFFFFFNLYQLLCGKEFLKPFFSTITLNSMKKSHSLGFLTLHQNVLSSKEVKLSTDLL